MFGAVAPVGVKGADRIFAFEVGIGEAGGEGGGCLLGFARVVRFVELEFVGVGALDPLFGVFFHFFFGEPAGSRVVGGAGGFGLTEFLTLLLVEVFGEGPLGLEGSGGALVFFDGGEVFAIGGGDDIGDGFLEVCGGCGFCIRGGGAREGEGGDLADVGESAGGGIVEGAREDAVGELGEDELDGGVVLKEGHNDFGALPGALGVAIVAVGVAEVAVVAEGPGVALGAVGAEGAAAAFGFGGGGGGGFGGGECGGGHGVSFLGAFSVQRSAISGTSVQRSAVRAFSVQR